MNPEKVKAVIGHELQHVKERDGSGIGGMLMKAMEAKLTGNASMLREEFRADKAGTRATSPDDMAGALVAMVERYQELKQFSRQLLNAFSDHNISTSALPARMAGLSSIAYTPFKMMPEKDPVKRKQHDKHDPHPNLLSRFDGVFTGNDVGDRSR